ncbi:MAG TPA: tRNA pseudouridine synthase A [Vicinamibacterales bacterium]|jgi:tRNA pseudouridine38-40 synthase|nr:tRNA pseudouridine synthase A [Vicinamibacterales bacterium]
MPTFKITVAYDGTGFVGWQRQAQGTSIQGLLEDALRVLDGRDVTVHGAGRTDAGVHALGQVASFTLERAIDAGAVLRATNAQLPAAIRVVRAEAVDSTFHARRSARMKTYGYRILNGDVPGVFERAYVWHVPGALDVNAMQAAARQLEGRHDFGAFQASGAATKTTVREVSAIEIFTTTEDTEGAEEKSRGQVSLHLAETCPHDDVRVPRVHRGGEFGSRVPRLLGGGALITIEITGTGFLRHMVRIIVGSLVEIGRGRQDAAWLGRVLASRDRTLAGPTAPPSGLFLLGVEYSSDVLADEC